MLFNDQFIPTRSIKKNIVMIIFIIFKWHDATTIKNYAQLHIYLAHF